MRIPGLTSLPCIPLSHSTKFQLIKVFRPQIPHRKKQIRVSGVQGRRMEGRNGKLIKMIDVEGGNAPAAEKDPELQLI